MDERLYRFLKYAAISLTLLWAGWIAYDSFFSASQPGDYAYHAGTNFFTDGYYTKALKEYEAALSEDPEYLPALRGRAEALIMLKREPEAIEIYDELIALQPDNAGNFANRGIAYDRLGKYENALVDYETSLSLDLEVGEGPGWMIRFFRKQAEKPPGIPERAGYIRVQLALPPAERVLQVPEEDEAQRPYKK